MAARDDGLAVHYTALQRGTPVFSSDGVEVGKVDQVLDNYREAIFDGLVLVMASGERRFVDAPEVERTAERAVTLNITAAECEQLGPPPSSSSSGGRVGGTFKRLFGRGR
jgi:hypothetical protein